MKTTTTIRILFAAATLLVLSLAAAFAGDTEKIQIKASDEQVVVLGGGETTVLRLEDLKDGESREFKGANGTVTVTRRGDLLEITSDQEGGGGHTMLVTADADENGHVVVHSQEGGAEAHTYTVRVGGDGDAHWTTEDGKVVELDVLSHALELHGEPHAAGAYVITQNDGGKVRTFSLAGEGEHLQWVSEGDITVYRCSDDHVVLTGPADTLGKALVTCPVCGKPMAEVKKETNRVVRMKVISEKDDPEKK